MTNLAFDTYNAVKDLEQAGMPVKQAESVVATLRKSREFDVSHLATKAGLNTVAVELDKKIDNVKSELKADIVASETRLDKKIDNVAANLDKKIDKVEAGLKADVATLDKKIDNVAANLDKKIDKVEAGLKADISGIRVAIAGVQVNTIKWIVPLLLGQTALIVALVKLLQYTPPPA